MAKASVIQMYNGVAGVTSVSIDMQDDGVILACQLGIVVSAMSADLDGGRAEVNFGSTIQSAINDARGVVISTELSMDLIGAAANTMRAEKSNYMQYGEGIPFFGGERIYLHQANLGANGIIQFSKALLVIEFKGGPVSRRR